MGRQRRKLCYEERLAQSSCSIAQGLLQAKRPAGVRVVGLRQTVAAKLAGPILR